MSGSGAKKGGWITFPFIIGGLLGLTLGGYGVVVANLIVYLITEFHVNSIDSAQISNVVNGCVCFFPIIGAIIADSYVGCFPVVSISSFVTLLGMVGFVLTATVDSLRPPSCEFESSSCVSPTKLQYAVLYTSITVVTLGMGIWRFSIGTMGANQYENPKDQEVFFNWYFFTAYSATVISSTVIVYVQDSVSWGLGFGLCFISTLIGLILFLLGKRFYCADKPQGSPFVDLARVVVACVKKRNAIISSRSEDYYCGDDKIADAKPSDSFRFLNKAALKTEGDVLTNQGKVINPWRLSTVQQVENLKALFRLFPLWLSTVLLSTPIAIQASLTVLQALVMDRHVGPNFQIPAGSMLVVTLVTASIFLSIIDRLVMPAWRGLTGHSPTPLQRIGAGHVLNALSMVVSALVESRRLKRVNSKDEVALMSAFWLFPQLVLVGLGEAFHFPGNVSLYYQEFPVSLRNTSTAMVSMVIGAAYYLSTALVDLLRRSTDWLPEDINKGRLDNVYWVVVVLGVANFGYYLVCAYLYKYQHAGGVSSVAHDDTTTLVVSTNNTNNNASV